MRFAYIGVTTLLITLATVAANAQGERECSRSGENYNESTNQFYDSQLGWTDCPSGPAPASITAGPAVPTLREERPLVSNQDESVQANYVDQVAACSSAQRDSASSCNPPEEVRSMLQQVAGMLQGGDIRNACKKMSILYGMASGLETVYATKCMISANSCKSKCRESINTYGTLSAPSKVTYQAENRNQMALLGKCQGNAVQSLSSYIQAGVSGYASVLNAKCADKVEDKTAPGGECETYEKQANNPVCPLFCRYAKNIDHEQCGCGSPELAETLTCKCKKDEFKLTALCKSNIPAGNPYPPIGGLGITGSSTGGTGNIPNTNTIGNLDDDIDDGIEQEYNPSGQAGGRGANSAYGDQGGGGVAALGGGSGAGGSGSGGGGSGPAGPEVNLSYGGAPGGGSAGGGSGYGGGGGGLQAQGGGYGNAGDKDKVDWKSLLPKFDKNRGPAGVDPELFNKGITAANGLSNFEKVTRKMNEKRETLLP